MSEALVGLSTHDLLVQLVREREDSLLTTEEDWYEGGLNSRKALDAEAVANLIEEVLEVAGYRPGH